MARIRTIKPEFWSNEKLSGVPEGAHMFAAAILNYCDDEGYFNANPKLIKAALYPIREPSLPIHGMLSELSRIGYLKLGSGTDGRTYGFVVNFTEHQKINRPSESKIKGLVDFTEDSMNVHGSFMESSLPDQGSGIRDQGKNERSLSFLEEGSESVSDKTKLTVPDRQGIGVEVENEQLQMLGKYRPVAEQIRKAWPDLAVQDTINVVTMGLTYLSRIPNPVEWIQEISLKRAPTDPVYISGRCTLHSWLITCMSREVSSIEAEKRKVATETREDEPPENLEHVRVPPIWEVNPNFSKPTDEEIAAVKAKIEMAKRRG